MHPGIGILHLVKLNEAVLGSGNMKNTYILTKYADYITEIILVQFNSHIAQVLFPLYSSHIWLIYMYFLCSQRLKQLNFDFTKSKISIPRYVSHIPRHLLGKKVIPLLN